MPVTTADTLLRNCLIFDGSGEAPFSGDIAVSQGRIAAIGDLSDVTAAHVIDVRGKAVAPGFIDVHSHDDYACIHGPDMTNKISQGVTTVVAGNCGLSIAPLRFAGEPEEPFNLLGDAKAFVYDSFADYTAAIDAACPAVNVAALIGHTTLRRICMSDLSRAASPDELERMVAILEDGLRAGATGLSSGVYYKPAYAADLNELTTLARAVSRHGGVYATHIRSEYDGIVDALHEAFATTRPEQTPLILSHHKCAGVHNWGRSSETLAVIDEASTEQPVAMDCYPYTAGSSVLNPDLCDGEIEVLISSSEAYPECAGRMLADIAAEWGIDQRAASLRLLPGFACYFQIHEDDMRRIMSHPLCMIGSDGLPNSRNPHPRLWGTFPRVLGRYARDLSLFSLSAAISKMTSLPAERFGFHDRGRLVEGLAADITVFDPDTILDTATFEAPVQISQGVEEVLVNGVHAWSQGKGLARRGGRFLRRSGRFACQPVA